MRRIHVWLMTAALILPSVSGCTSAPRVRPVKMGDVDTGAQSVEAVRRQLQGTWELVSLDVFTPSGEKVPTQASGRLEYDQYGNIAIKGGITGNGSVDPAVLNLTGRVTVDPVTHTLTVGGVTAASADDRRIDPKLDPGKVRFYAFEGDLLKTTVKDAAGKTTATLTWKKVG